MNDLKFAAIFFRCQQKLFNESALSQCKAHRRVDCFACNAEFFIKLENKLKAEEELMENGESLGLGHNA